MSELNLYQKLIEVRKSCEYLKKDAKGDRFNFVSSSKTLGTLRAKMDEMGLLLVPSVTGNEVRRHENNQYKESDPIKRQYFTILEMSFMWVNADNPKETIVCGWTGQGLDDAEKGVGKAVTYAEKYFLLKFFNIPTDKDDPDSFQKKTDAQKKTAEPEAPTIKASAKLFNEMQLEIGECTEATVMAKWFTDNVDRITTGLSADDKVRLKAVYKEYSDIFKKEAKA